MRAAYFRVTGDEELQGLVGPTLIPCIGRFDPVEPREGAQALLSLISPHAFGPPELCFWESEGGLAGAIVGEHGQGRCAFVPWEVGRQYWEEGRPEHAQLMAALVRHVAPGAAPFETDAPPQLELVLRVSAAGRTLMLHALNHSGCTPHSVTDPIPIQGVSVQLEVPGPVDDVYAARARHPPLPRGGRGADALHHSGCGALRGRPHHLRRGGVPPVTSAGALGSTLAI